jgi:hypothetical protein
MGTRKVVQAVNTQQSVLPIMQHTLTPEKRNLTVRNGKRVAKEAQQNTYIAAVEQKKESATVNTPSVIELVSTPIVKRPTNTRLAITPVVPVEETPTVVEVVKRKPGRPKGSGVKKVETVTMPKVETVVKESEPVTNDAPVVKRGPGRPKGSGKKQIMAELPVQTVKKSPGRPRKAVVNVETPDTIVKLTETPTVVEVVEDIALNFSTTARPLYIMRLPLTMDVPSAVQSRIIDERYILPTAEEVARWKSDATMLVRNPEFAAYAAMKQETDKPVKALYNANTYGSHLLPVFAIIDYVDNKANNAGTFEAGITEYSAPYQTFASRRTPRNTISVETLRVSHVNGTQRGNMVMGADILNAMFYALDAPQLRGWIENLLTSVAPSVRRIGESEAQYNARIKPVATVAPVAPKGKTVNVEIEARQLAKSRLSQLMG